jgi:hypothetical protein
MPTRALLLAPLLLGPGATPAAAGLVESVFGGTVPCVELVDQDGVQFCEGSFGHRVESFDGVPIDLNVTLPPAGQTGPFPLVFSMHGWGGGKSGSPQVDFALDSYAVVSSSGRGFHGSCGTPEARATDPSLAEPDVCETRGWTHLADARFEAHDIQHIAGLLADEGIAIPDKIGVTGASYGGGRSLILAALRNRVMLPDGSLVPWQSPGGLDMEIAAAAALIPWSDLTASLQPNGSTLDGRASNPYGPRVGVSKKVWISALFIGGKANGYYAPAGVDPSADLFGWQSRIEAGEPYDSDESAAGISDELSTYHSAYGIDDGIAPAPSFIYNAWTDDLFPADEAVRLWRKTVSIHPDAEFALHFADNFGHPRAGLDADPTVIVDRVGEFFARHLKDVGGPLPGIEVYTQPCGGSTLQGPFTASDWDALRGGEVQHASANEASFTGEGGNPDTAAELMPLLGGPCRTVPAEDDPGAATWTFPAAQGAGYTLMGSPRVVARLTVVGSEFAQVASRLWDVAPDGTQSLVTHDFYRPRRDGAEPQVFELHPNGWHFAAGHAPKLELLGQSDPTGQPSTGEFSVAVSGLELRLPVLENPDGGAISEPLALVEATPDCPVAPLEACTEATGGARLKLQEKSSGDRFKFQWKGDPGTTPEDFAVGADGSGFGLCVYGGDDAFLMALSVPTSGTCGDKPCWKEGKSSFQFKDRKAERTGVKSAKLQASSRKAKIQLQAQGELGFPELPLAETPLTAQLIDAAGGCWGAALSDVRKNEPGKVDARN